MGLPKPRDFALGHLMGRRHKDEPAGLHPLDPQAVCLNREHSPPSNLHVPAGHKWVHYCPGCGNKSVIYSSDTIC